MLDAQALLNFLKDRRTIRRFEDKEIPDDVAKLNPFVLSTSMKKLMYYKIGKEIGRAWNVGRNYKKEYD